MIFREYDIRGVAESQLTPETVRCLGRAIGTYIARSGGGRAVLVGRDLRLSSDRLRDNLVEGLLAAGCRVIDIGQVVTPILYYSRVLYGVDAAVMITASHNPPEFNGLKVACGPGTLYGAEIQRLHGIAAAGEFVIGQGGYEQRDPVPAYLEMLRARIRLGRPLRVAVDPLGGTAALFAVQVAAGWGCAVIPLHERPDPAGTVCHPDPVRPENLNELIRAVRAHGADLGVAYDGDGDRLGVVDDRGRIVWGDALMALLWREVLRRHPGATALIEVKCSRALWEEVERLGGRPQFTRTGHSLIKARMRELDAPFAGEMSGHLFFADEYYGFDDAFYATGRLLRMLAAQERPLSALVDGLPRYPVTPEVRVDCPDERKFAAVAAVRAHLARRFPVIDVDGARVLFPEGWGLIRASNTQPALVLRAEGRTPEALAAICAELGRALAAVAGIPAVSWE